MKASLDLAVFHEMTGGDSALERKLFGAFLESSAACLAAMQNSWQEGMERTWQQRAHALKGLCLNLGAERLGKLCKKAQDDCAAAPEKKRELLEAIRNEFEKVKRQLDKEAP